ncbi:MAG: hypothetical protein KDD61_14765 [Bdellovibrionales bacterium]|nr:hypothetical protein [Bdellovibrionales bacterium]
MPPIKLAILVLLSAIYLFSSASAFACGREQTQWLKHDGKMRSYRIYKPCTWQREKPALLIFHPSQSSGKGMSDTLNAPVVGIGMNELARTKGFMVIYPDGLNNRGYNLGARVWNDGRGFIGEQSGINDNDDLGFINALLNHITNTEKANPKKIYATGLAMGGAFSYSLLCHMSERFAGIASVASHLSERVMRSCPMNNKKLKLLMINGSWDTAAPYCAPHESLSPLLPDLCRDVTNYDQIFEKPNQADLTVTTGEMLSAFSTQTLFLRRKNCVLDSQSPVIDSISSPNDLTAFKEFNYHCAQGGPDSAKVVAIFGGGHVWPGGKEASGRLKDYFIWLVGPVSHEFNGSEYIWNYFTDN